MQTAPLWDKVSIQSQLQGAHSREVYNKVTQLFAELHQAYLWPPVNHFHADLSGTKDGGGGRITPSVISMALLTNRIGVNKLELFLRDVEWCPIGTLR